MTKIRVVWRWALAIVVHVGVLIAILQIADGFYNNTVRPAAEGLLPHGIRLQDWIGMWDIGWNQAITMFVVIAAAISFSVFIIWNIIFAIPSVVFKGSKMAKILFFPAVLVVLLGQVLIGMFYRPEMAIEGFAGTVPLFIGGLAFYLIGLAFLVPFLIAIIFCSPYCISSFKNWFSS